MTWDYHQKWTYSLVLFYVWWRTLEHVRCQRCHVNGSFICISFRSGEEIVKLLNDHVFQITGIISNSSFDESRLCNSHPEMRNLFINSVYEFTISKETKWIFFLSIAKNFFTFCIHLKRFFSFLVLYERPGTCDDFPPAFFFSCFTPCALHYGYAFNKLSRNAHARIQARQIFQVKINNCRRKKSLLTPKQTRAVPILFIK